jgi:hypothetical protein
MHTNSSIIKLKNWLNKPFPFYETNKQKVLIPITFSLLVMFGIIILNPAENPDLLLKQVLNVFTYGSIVIFVSLIFSLVLPVIYPNIFNDDKWNILKTILFFVISIVTIDIIITIYAYHFDNSNKIDYFSLLFTIIIRSIVLNFFPLILIVFYSERSLYKKNYFKAVEIISELRDEKQTKQIDNQIYTFAKGTNDEIKISEKNLLYIKAEGNYCLLVYNENSILKNKLVRSSLKNIEHLTNKSNHFVRCHKSYIVNLNKISNVSGNAKGYTFYLKNHNFQIPVSRSFSKALIRKIKANNN